MGLDTYAVKAECDEKGMHLNPDEGAFSGVGPLVGGLFSGNGNDGSFRGKVYSHIVEEATGQSLYQEYIAPETVATMADRLAVYEDDEVEDLAALKAFFAVCKERCYGLVGWW